MSEVPGMVYTLNCNANLIAQVRSTSTCELRASFTTMKKVWLRETLPIRQAVRLHVCRRETLVIFPASFPDPVHV